ncbi:MAG: hypothetical protein ABSE73_13845 [Planctomycetota bacterium]
MAEANGELMALAAEVRKADSRLFQAYRPCRLKWSLVQHYIGTLRQPHLADRELKGTPPEEPALNGQYHLLQGAVAFRRGDIETGVAE